MSTDDWVRHHNGNKSPYLLTYPESVIPGLGMLLLVCTVVYAVPRTSILGAILLTGYLGGATATHVRIGDPLFPILFPSLVGVLVWGGLFLRDERLRALIPLRRSLIDNRLTRDIFTPAGRTAKRMKGNNSSAHVLGKKPKR